MHVGCHPGLEEPAPDLIRGDPSQAKAQMRVRGLRIKSAMTARCDTAHGLRVKPAMTARCDVASWIAGQARNDRNSVIPG